MNALTPAQITAWGQAAALLISIVGVSIAQIRTWFDEAHGDLTEEQLLAGWGAIEADAAVRAALAEAASGQTPPA